MKKIGTLNSKFATRYFQYGNTISNHSTKNEVSIKDFFSKCDQICSFLRSWSHLLNKSFMKNFILCAVNEMTIIVYCIYIKVSVLWKANPISRFLNKTLVYPKVITVRNFQCCQSLITRGEKLPSNAVLLSNSYEIVTFERS